MYPNCIIGISAYDTSFSAAALTDARKALPLGSCEAVSGQWCESGGIRDDAYDEIDKEWVLEWIRKA